MTSSPRGRAAAAATSKDADVTTGERERERAGEARRGKEPAWEGEMTSGLRLRQRRQDETGAPVVRRRRRTRRALSGHEARLPTYHGKRLLAPLKPSAAAFPQLFTSPGIALRGRWQMRRLSVGFPHSLSLSHCPAPLMLPPKNRREGIPPPLPSTIPRDVTSNHVLDTRGR